MKKIILSVITILLFASCEKFLDVNPVNKAYEDDLLTDRSGFESVLAGAYLGMTTKAMFGKEMKYGFLETLGATYNNLGTTHYYYRGSRHEYGYPNPVKSIEDIWGVSYQIINQLNTIMKNIDAIKADPFHDIVRGETIGTRAFLHFQLLKLFGPVISQEGLNATAIPYVDKTGYKGVKFSTAGQVIDKLNAELAEAKKLLEGDPIRTTTRNANLNQYGYEKYNSLIDHRGARMNYYAIVAMQSMVAQWAGDSKTAATYAEELIQELESRSNSIHLATSGELAQAIERRMPMESIFTLMNPELLNFNIEVNPLIENPSSSTTSPLLFPNYTLLLNGLYNAADHGSLNDVRLVNWFALSSNSSTVRKVVKYHFPQSYLYTDLNYRKYFESKLIGLHQIYMIAAEEYAKSNPAKAMLYLNKVRAARGLTINLSFDASRTEGNIKNLIFEEMRKENISEGTMFAEYKRLFRAIPRSTPVAPSLAIFKLPIPADENLYNPQN